VQARNQRGPPTRRGDWDHHRCLTAVCSAARCASARHTSSQDWSNQVGGHFIKNRRFMHTLERRQAFRLIQFDRRPAVFAGGTNGHHRSFDRFGIASAGGQDARQAARPRQGAKSVSSRTAPSLPAARSTAVKAQHPAPSQTQRVSTGVGVQAVGDAADEQNVMQMPHFHRSSSPLSRL